jgi:hypothetical protein
VVAHDPGRRYANGIADLLQQHGVTVDVASWSKATAQRAEPYDVVVVTGAGRHRSIDAVDFDRPVLGYGVFGCAYFGRLHLKNGQPYT